MPRIYSPEGSPSAVSTENFLIAKSISAPAYTHNIAHTRYERTSNWMAEEPRFSNKVSLLHNYKDLRINLNKKRSCQ